MVTLTRTTRGTSNFDYGDTMIDTDNLVGNELTSKGGTFSPSVEGTFVTGLALISQRLTRCSMSEERREEASNVPYEFDAYGIREEGIILPCSVGRRGSEKKQRAVEGRRGGRSCRLFEVRRRR